MPEYNTTTKVHVIPDPVTIPGSATWNWFKISGLMKALPLRSAGISVAQKMTATVPEGTTMNVKTMQTGYATMTVTVTEGE